MSEANNNNHEESSTTVEPVHRQEEEEASISNNNISNTNMDEDLTGRCSDFEHRQSEYTFADAVMGNNVEFLLEHQEKVKKLNKSGELVVAEEMTLLHLAASRNNVVLVKLLVEHLEANVLLRDDCGMTARDWAREHNNEMLAEFLRQKEEEEQEASRPNE